MRTRIWYSDDEREFKVVLVDVQGRESPLMGKFPTKELAEQQQQKLEEWINSFQPIY